MDTILVLGDYENGHLVDIIYNLGILPVLKETMESALSSLRHDNFAAIIIDHERAGVDRLEFILNAWDVYGQIPVIVIDKANKDDDELAVLKKENVFHLTEEHEDIDMEIARILLNQTGERF